MSVWEAASGLERQRALGGLLAGPLDPPQWAQTPVVMAPKTALGPCPSPPAPQPPPGCGPHPSGFCFLAVWLRQAGPFILGASSHPPLCLTSHHTLSSSPRCPHTTPYPQRRRGVWGSPTCCAVPTPRPSHTLCLAATLPCHPFSTEPTPTKTLTQDSAQTAAPQGPASIRATPVPPCHSLQQHCQRKHTASHVCHLKLSSGYTEERKKSQVHLRLDNLVYLTQHNQDMIPCFEYLKSVSFFFLC